MRLVPVLLAAYAAMTSPLPAQAADPAPAAPAAAAPATIPLDAGEGRAVALKLADELMKAFVYRDQAAGYAAMLKRNAAAGRYDSGTRGSAAKLMTGDLMAVRKDGHLHVMVAGPDEHHGGAGGAPKDFPPLIQSEKWIAAGIAYIRFTAFMSTDEELATVRAFMRDHKDAATMIFDLRNHHGGGLGEMDAIFPYLFAARTSLVKMEMPRTTFDEFGSPYGDGPTLEFAKDPAHVTATHYAAPGDATPLRDAKVYLLVSNKTASAGEHFALALKSTGRATLIGENTAGANHFGGPAPLNDHFAVWMPVGRTYDIKSGKDWEGDGIAPDVQADPRQALVIALEKAGVSHAQAVKLDAQEVPAEPVHSEKVQAR